jgi:hypothetical protein
MLREGAAEAWAAVVLTVKVEVTGAPLVVIGAAGFSEQVGGGLAAVIMMQLIVTVPVKPPEGTKVTVEVADPPAVTGAGMGEADRLKSGTACTVKLTDPLWLTDPEVPLIVTL